MSIPKIRLNNGIIMPALALGCWSGTTEEQHESAKPWIVTALQTGIRHLDTALSYGTEGPVGKAIREAGIPREEVFITTKLPPHHYEKIAQSFQESLNNLGTDYIDLWLMHWPQAFPNIDENSEPRHPSASGEPGQGHIIALDSPTLNEVWAEIEKIYETGKVKAIGVSNFSVKTLKQLLTTAKIVPAVNQIEMHPYQAQPELLTFAKEKGIILTAYSSTGYGTVREDPTIRRLAAKYSITEAQLVLAWHLARGTAAATKSTNTERQRTNFFELPSLEADDIELINTLHKNVHLCNYPGLKDGEYEGPRIAMGWTYERLGW